MKTITQDTGSTLWTIDPIHTTVAFGVRHLLVTNVHGVFERVSDVHLRSADFFDAAAYPLITFQSTKVRSTGEDSLAVTGTLTMRGVAREVVLAVTGSRA